MTSFENPGLFWEERAPKSVARLQWLRSARYRCFCGQVLWLTPNSYKDLIIFDPTELRYLWYQCPLEDILYCHENSTFIDYQGKEDALLSTWYLRRGPRGGLYESEAPLEIGPKTPEAQLKIETEEVMERMVDWLKRCETAIAELRSATRFVQFSVKSIDPAARLWAIEKLQDRMHQIQDVLIAFERSNG